MPYGNGTVMSAVFAACLLAVTASSANHRQLKALERAILDKWQKKLKAGGGASLEHAELERLGHVQWQLHATEGKQQAYSSIDSLLKPEGVQSFLRSWYQRRPLYIPADDAKRFTSIFNFSSVEPFLRFSTVYHDDDLSRYQKHGLLELWQNGEQVFAPPGMGLADFRRVFDDGISLVLNAVHNSHIGAYLLTSSFQREFGVAAQCNVYITKPLEDQPLYASQEQC